MSCPIKMLIFHIFLLTFTRPGIMLAIADMRRLMDCMNSTIRWWNHLVGLLRAFQCWAMVFLPGTVWKRDIPNLVVMTLSHISHHSGYLKAIRIYYPQTDSDESNSERLFKATKSATTSKSHVFFNDLGLPITVLFLVIVLGLAKSHCFGNPHYFSIFFWGLPLADIVSCHQDSSRVGADEHRCLRFGRGARWKWRWKPGQFRR